MNVEAGGVAWAEWFSAAGTFTAAAVAVVVALRAERHSRDAATEARQAASRDRTASLMVQLVTAVEEDARTTARDFAMRPVRSPRGAAVCRALWGHRNTLGTVWQFYTAADDDPWIMHLYGSEELWPWMRNELQSALDKLDYADRKPPDLTPSWWKFWRHRTAED